jgi:hypothetical protein
MTHSFPFYISLTFAILVTILLVYCIYIIDNYKETHLKNISIALSLLNERLDTTYTSFNFVKQNIIIDNKIYIFFLYLTSKFQTLFYPNNLQTQNIRKGIDNTNIDYLIFNIYFYLKNENLNEINNFIEIQIDYLKNRRNKINKENTNWQIIIFDSIENIEYQLSFLRAKDILNSRDWQEIINKIEIIEKLKYEEEIEYTAEMYIATENLILLLIAKYLLNNDFKIGNNSTRISLK